MTTNLLRREPPQSRVGGPALPPSPLRSYASSRVLTILVAVIAAARAGVSAVTFLNQWDGKLFVAVAQYFYGTSVPGMTFDQAQSLRAFFPLYPLLIRVVAWLPGVSLPLAAIAVSLTAGAVAVVLVHRIALRLTDPAGARRALLLFSFFPGAVVLSMPYSEGIMIALSAAALLALLDERWLAAGVYAALATATRASALGLVAACLCAAVQAHRRGGGWRPFVAPALAPVGTAAFFAFLWARTGDPLAYLNAERAWGSGLGMGAPARRLAIEFVRAPFTSVLATTATLSLIAAVVGVAVLVRRGWPPVLSVYSVSVLGIGVLCRVEGLRPRDVLTAFPLFLAVGDGLRGNRYRSAAIVLGTVMAFSVLFHNLGSWGQP